MLTSRRIPLLAAACGLLVVVFATPSAADFDTALAGLGSESRAEIRSSIEELSRLDDPRALPALEAMLDKRLRVGPDGALYEVIEAESGAPATLRAIPSGEAVAAIPDDALREPLVNNMVRRILGPTVAQLKLRSPDAGVRMEAARELSSGASEGALAAMRAALEVEDDLAIRRVLSLGLAEADIASPDPRARVAAIELLGEQGDRGIETKLRELLARDESGAFVEPDASVRDAAEGALTRLELRTMLVDVAGNLLYGLSLASVLLLAALGLAITFGLMRVINMAHGEMIMIGAYTTYVVQNLFAAHAPDWQDAYVVAAVPAAFAVCGVVGMALERGVIRHLYGRPLETLLATWGISLMLIQTVRLMFGAQNVEVANPSWLSGGFELFEGLVLPASRIAIVLFAAAAVSVVWFVLQRTPLGLYVRAVTQNRDMAACLGILTRRIDTWTFGLGSAIAGLGGVALSQLGNVGPELGQATIVDSFLVVVIGGVGKIAGTVVAALGLGIVNKLLEPAAGAVFGKIIVLVFIIVFVQRRPQGIFALRGRAGEA